MSMRRKQSGPRLIRPYATLPLYYSITLRHVMSNATAEDIIINAMIAVQFALLTITNNGNK